MILNTVRYRLVALLAEHGQMSVSDAAKALGAKPSVVSRRAIWLEESGLVERQSTPFDKRRTELRVTEAGRRSLVDA